MIKAKAAPSAEQIKGFERRINNLLDEKQTIGVDVADIYTEAKHAGVNTTALRKVIAKRRAKAPDPEVVAAMEAYEFALDEAASMVSNGSTSLRKAAADTGFSKSAIHRRASHRNENASSGTVSETADGNPSGESSRHDRRPDGPGSALATNSEAETGSATVVTTGNLDALSPGSAENCGPGLSTGFRGSVPADPRSLVAPRSGCLDAIRTCPSTSPQRNEHSTDAARLRAQIPASTDPAWLEREAERVEAVSDDPWESAMAAKAKLDALKAARGIA